MKQIFSFGLTAALLLACLTGCGGQAGDTALGGTAPSGGQTPPASFAPETPAGEISREEALAIALENAGVLEGDAYNVKNETDSDNGIPLYDIEFETDYGDYDFEVAMADGRIVGADYEVDEEWLDALGGSQVSLEEAPSRRKRPLPSWPARSPAPARRMCLSGRSPAMAGAATRGSCSWTA